MVESLTLMEWRSHPANVEEAVQKIQQLMIVFFLRFMVQIEMRTHVCL